MKTLRQIRDGDAHDPYTAAARDSIKAAELKAKVAMYTERIKDSPRQMEPILARGQYYARLTIRPATWKGRGRINPYRQDTDKAWRAQLNMSSYNTKIKENPKSYGAYIKRGDAYVDLLKDQKALEDYGEAVTLLPDAPEVYLKRGAVYYRLGQVEKAAEDYGKVLKLSPSDVQAAEAHYQRGEIYAKAGNQKGAIRAYFRAVELNAAYLERIGADYREAVAGDVSRAMMK